ncbi:hypothetical protein Aspvir_003212 [Aspergillus viridinutans]|uniref:Fatty acid hydroxylase domain-containing protein n=1 Tax=Aspergillus viridinutans TaxID=75553 RepID=A0A9P3C9B0_ASPVI|nr:uncharacterized protein Aspvir_003212 [Aspergillus viridinutans]GIK07546.1 hypothetical protein Aspvir_003212 [Aspergillus viridinutans]
METKGNPKDSMKSTWRTASRDTWSLGHWLIHILNAYPLELDKEVPVHSKNEPIPFMPQWSMNLWVIFYSSLPLALHQAYAWYTGRNLGPLATFNLYMFAFNAIVIYQVHILRRLGHIYGFLDGDKHERDGVPDVGVGKVVASVYKTTGSRLALSVYFSYQTSQLPAQMNWYWLPIEVGLYGIVLDFWFYCTPILCSRHTRTNEQEFGDMVGVPMMTYFTLRLLGLPMGFYEWWICHEYVVFAEVFGHSGLRLHLTVPSPLSWLLQWFDAEIVIEDHDLHHRKGWRKSHNYGKQTRLWDRIFGTCYERIESAAENVDYANTARMPLF